MAERPLADHLDELIDALLARREAAAPAALEPLVRVAEELRDLPNPVFKKKLKIYLERKVTMSTTTVNPIRTGFRTVTPYLIVQQAAELIDFVSAAYGAQPLYRGTGPAGGIHAEVRIGDSMVMIGGGGAWRGTPMPTALQYYVPNADEVYERALQAGAVSLFGPTEDYGDRFAAIKDPFGNEWYISTHLGAAYVPEGLHDITVYLHPMGAPRLIDFMKQAFEATEMARFDSPEGRVMHAKLRVGDSVIAMGEAHGPWQPMPTTIYMYMPEVDAVYRRAMEAGATSLAQPADQPYGDRVAAVQDTFGNQWYIATHIADQSLT